MIKYSHINQLVYKDPLAFSQVEPGVFCRKEAMKVCTKCGERKPASAFNKHRKTVDGLNNYCRDCNKIISLESHYRRKFDGKRKDAIKRDGNRCVKCGMTREDHREEYGRDITVDHIDGRGCNSKKKNNKLSNLQTLCLKCHGKKDAKRMGKFIPVVRIKGNERVVFESMTQGAKSVDGQVAGVHFCLTGRYKQAYGYKWEYASQEELGK